MACRLVLSAAPSRWWWVIVCVLLPGFFWRTNCCRPYGSGGAGAFDFVSGSSPGPHFTGCDPCFLRLPPGGELQFFALRIKCVNRFLSASMTLHSFVVCEYWVPWQGPNRLGDGGRWGRGCPHQVPNDGGVPPR